MILYKHNDLDILIGLVNQRNQAFPDILSQLLLPYLRVVIIEVRIRVAVLEGYGLLILNRLEHIGPLLVHCAAF